MKNLIIKPSLFLSFGLSLKNDNANDNPNIINTSIAYKFISSSFLANEKYKF